MVTPYLWVGIAVGVFFGGLGIGYAIFQTVSTPQNFMMSPQQMQQMMGSGGMMGPMMGNP